MNRNFDYRETVKAIYHQGLANRRVESLVVRPVEKITFLVSNPQDYYTQRAQVPLFRVPYNMIVTRIHLVGSSAAQEIAGDLKYADDIQAFNNPVIIDVCDTTAGVFTATSGFDTTNIPSGKYIYFQMDASPNAAIVDFYIEVYLTLGS